MPLWKNYGLKLAYPIAIKLGPHEITVGYA